MLNTRAPGSRSASRAARAASGSITLTLRPCSTSARAIAAPSSCAPHTTTSCTSARRGATSCAPLARRAAASPTTTMRSPGLDLRVAAHEDRPAVADDRRRCATRPAAARPRSVAATTSLAPSRHVELDDLDAPLREHVGVPRRRHADRRRRRPRGLQLGGDDEVDVEPALAPDIDVIRALRTHDRLRARARRCARTCRRRGWPRRARCRRSPARHRRSPRAAARARWRRWRGAVATS